MPAKKKTNEAVKIDKPKVEYNQQLDNEVIQILSRTLAPFIKGEEGVSLLLMNTLSPILSGEKGLLNQYHEMRTNPKEITK